MPGTDLVGATRVNSQVNLYLVRVSGNSLLLSVISAGVQLSQIPDFDRGFAGPTAGNVLGAALGQQLGRTSGELIYHGIDVAPTLEIRGAAQGTRSRRAARNADGLHDVLP